MFSAASIELPLGGWVSEPNAEFVWTNPAGDVLSAHYFPIPPDLPGPLSDLTSIRAYYRKMLGRNGAIVEVNSTTVSSLPALRTIVKIKQEPCGMTYVAAATVPFAQCSFVAKVQCPERGLTGIRDTAVAAKLGLVGASGWASDPYMSRVRNPILRNRSDDQEWDDVFPEHPLSRARRHLKHLCLLSLPHDVESLAVFHGNPSAVAKPSFLRRFFGGCS
jgi:hypothetical protein